MGSAARHDRQPAGGSQVGHVVLARHLLARALVEGIDHLAARQAADAKLAAHRGTLLKAIDPGGVGETEDGPSLGEGDGWLYRRLRGPALLQPLQQAQGLDKSGRV